MAIENPPVVTQQSPAQSPLSPEPNSSSAAPSAELPPPELVRPLTPHEVAQITLRALGDLKTHLIYHKVVQQWEADHLFEPILKHLSGV